MTQRSTAAPRKVVYVMGAGRSGSTILGVCLGNCEGFFYGGELEEWLMRAQGPRWASAERQRFWDAVKERVHGAESLFGDLPNRAIERSSAILRLDLWPARWRMRKAYRRVAKELIEAVAAVAGASYVVDTSHFPLRARELRAMSGIELYLVYLVRDPHAVVASNTRELSPHEVAETRWLTLVTNVDLWLTQMVSTLTFLSHPADRRLLVRHEDFLTDPEGILSQILALTDADVTLPDLSSPLRVGAPLQANRLIRAETVSVQRSAKPAPVPRRLLTRLMQAPWRLVLGWLGPAARPASE